MASASALLQGERTAVRTRTSLHPWHRAPRDPAPSPGCRAGDARGHGASELGACRTRGGHGRQLGAGDIHGRRIREPSTAGWGLYFVRVTALAASPGSWGSGCYIKANNAAVVPSLPSPEVGRAGEPPNWTIIAHICWLTCAADGNSVCRIQRGAAAARVMEGTVKSGPQERPESGSWRPRDENPQPCGGAGVPQPRPCSHFGGTHSHLAGSQLRGGDPPPPPPPRAGMVGCYRPRELERLRSRGPAGSLAAGWPRTVQAEPTDQPRPLVSWQIPEPPHPPHLAIDLPRPGHSGRPHRPHPLAVLADPIDPTSSGCPGSPHRHPTTTPHMSWQTPQDPSALAILADPQKNLTLPHPIPSITSYPIPSHPVPNPLVPSSEAQPGPSPTAGSCGQTGEGDRGQIQPPVPAPVRGWRSRAGPSAAVLSVTQQKARFGSDKIPPHLLRGRTLPVIAAGRETWAPARAGSRSPGIVPREVGGHVTGLPGSWLAAHPGSSVCPPPQNALGCTFATSPPRSLRALQLGFAIGPGDAVGGEMQLPFPAQG